MNKFVGGTFAAALAIGIAQGFGVEVFWERLFWGFLAAAVFNILFDAAGEKAA